MFDLHIDEADLTTHPEVKTYFDAKFKAEADLKKFCQVYDNEVNRLRSLCRMGEIKYSRCSMFLRLFKDASNDELYSYVLQASEGDPAYKNYEKRKITIYKIFDTLRALKKQKFLVKARGKKEVILAMKEVHKKGFNECVLNKAYRVMKEKINLYTTNFALTHSLDEYKFLESFINFYTAEAVEKQKAALLAEKARIESELQSLFASEKIYTKKKLKELKSQEAETPEKPEAVVKAIKEGVKDASKPKTSQDENTIMSWLFGSKDVMEALNKLVGVPNPA